MLCPNLIQFDSLIHGKMWLQFAPTPENLPEKIIFLRLVLRSEEFGSIRTVGKCRKLKLKNLTLWSSSVKDYSAQKSRFLLWAPQRLSSLSTAITHQDTSVLQAASPSSPASLERYLGSPLWALNTTRQHGPCIGLWCVLLHQNAFVWYHFEVFTSKRRIGIPPQQYPY